MWSFVKLETKYSNNYKQVNRCWEKEYQTHLNALVDCICFLQQQGLAFPGHDESKDSNNQGNFLELLWFLAKHNEEIDKVVLENAPEN